MRKLKLREVKSLAKATQPVNEQGNFSPGYKCGGQSIPGGGNSQCKGHEVGISLLSFRRLVWLKVESGRDEVGRGLVPQ